jgi:hypothetical protein
MSQIVSAFAMPSSALPEVQRHLNSADWHSFWKCVRPFQIEADLAYGGYVVVVMAEYLRDLGIELPVSRDSAVQKLVESCHPLACTNGPDATAAARTLAEVSASDAELAAYWRDFTGDEELEAGAAMQAALGWLRRVFVAGQEADWFIILEG